RRPPLFPPQVRAHEDHHLRHGGSPGLHRRDRALHPEQRRARAQYLCETGSRRSSRRGAGRSWCPARPGRDAGGSRRRRGLVPARHPHPGQDVKRPLIGITIGYSSQDREIFSLRDDYVRAVEKAGGLPLVLAPGTAKDAPSLLDHLDGLLLTGGADVDPELYGEAPHESVTRVIPERDALEIALCREALRRDMPLLAICRGQQVLNVATGGTLVQDLPSQWKGAVNHDPEGERWSPAHDV